MPVAEPLSFDDFLLLVGRLNYAWTNTESLFIHLIAGLTRMDKETAVVVFLTLNTSRARIELVERLSKMTRHGVSERKAILALTARMVKLSHLRNRFNHCIYAFDSEGGHPKTILMRIADRKDTIKMGQTSDIDQGMLTGIAEAIDNLGQLNRDIWAFVQRHNYPV
jgi:hypothetical protein